MLFFPAFPVLFMLCWLCAIARASLGLLLDFIALNSAVPSFSSEETQVTKNLLCLVCTLKLLPVNLQGTFFPVLWGILQVSSLCRKGPQSGRSKTQLEPVTFP